MTNRLTETGTCVGCGDYTLQGVLCPGCKDVPEYDGTRTENPFVWRASERKVAPSASSQLVAHEARKSASVSDHAGELVRRFQYR